MYRGSTVATRVCVLLALCSLLFLVGCATVGDVWIAEGFSAECLRQDGLVVGGVVDAASMPDGYWEQSRARLFQDSLREGDDGLPARDAEALILDLGSERYAELAEEYGSDGELCTESLVEIADCAVGARYILFARIIRNEVQKSEESKYNWDTEERTYTKSTVREVEIIAQVFDLEAGTVVWRALGSHRLGGGTVYQEQEDDRGLGERVIHAVLGGGPAKEPEHPDAPSTEQVLWPILRSLAAELRKV